MDHGGRQSFQSGMLTHPFAPSKQQVAEGPAIPLNCVLGFRCPSQGCLYHAWFHLNLAAIPGCTFAASDTQESSQLLLFGLFCTIS